TIEMRGAIIVSAKSSSTDIGSVSDVMLMVMIGSLFGLFFRNDGADVIVGGRSGIAAAIAVWTSVVALSMSRPRSNCIVMLVLPVPLRDVIESRPAIVVNCRSSGLATDEDIVMGSPPGRFALTFSVG